VRLSFHLCRSVRIFMEDDA